MNAFLLNRLSELKKTMLKAQEEFAFLDGLVNILPELDYKFIDSGGYRCHASLFLAVKNLGDVKPIIDALPAVPLGISKKDFTIIAPLASFKPDEQASHIFGMVLCGEPYGHPGRLEAKWFTKLQDTIACVKVNVALYSQHIRWEGKMAMRGGGVYIRDDKFTHTFTGCQVITSGSGLPDCFKSPYRLYWPVEADIKDVLKLA